LILGIWDLELWAQIGREGVGVGVGGATTGVGIGVTTDVGVTITLAWTFLLWSVNPVTGLSLPSVCSPTAELLHGRKHVRIKIFEYHQVIASHESFSFFLLL
jgi:hypothetical protein